jgi:hypothetical protein
LADFLTLNAHAHDALRFYELNFSGTKRQNSSLKFLWERETRALELLPPFSPSLLSPPSDGFRASLVHIFLNADIALIILNKLSVNDLIRGRVACRRWKDLISRVSISLLPVKDPQVRDYDSSDDEDDA